MNRKQRSVVVAGLLALALAGCGSMRGSKMPEDSAGATSSGTSSNMGSGASSTGSGASSIGSASSEGGAGSMAGTASGSTASPQSQQMPGSAPPAAGASAPNAMVMAIEAMPKQGTGAVGGSGAGTTGSSMGEEKMYRVTLRMDDGTTMVVTQATPPTFRMGDRVNMTDGTISH
jgi:outer membrane lipoprotein SlyB